MPRRAPASDSRIAGRIKLRDLHILSSVVQFGSMAKAASHLAITQPTVSEAIADLEHAVGVRLLDRGPRGVTPTVYGDALLKRGLEAFDSLNQGMRDIDFLSKPGAGEVWIGCGEPLMGGVVSATIQRLAQYHPDVIVHAAQVNASDFDFRPLRERKLDLMLGRKLMPNVDDDLALEVLFEEQLVVVVGARNRWAGRREVTLAELLDERWIFSEPTNAVQLVVSGAFRSNGLNLPKIGVVSTSMHLRFSLLATGQYVSAIPSALVRYNADPWQLKILPVDLGVRLPCGIITLKNRTLSPVVQLFIENARSVAKLITNCG
jgi:DNA-binding transcriptional LysR family regulator